MLISNSYEANTINLSSITDRISMLAFDLVTLEGVPNHLMNVVKSMLKTIPRYEGEAFLTVHHKLIKANQTHRRPGAHIDGNYIKNVASWGGGGGWKVGGDGKTLSPEAHRLSYETKTGGMLIASDYPACRGWNGIFNDSAGLGGDCSHIKALESRDNFILKPNTVYYGTSQFIHESLPVDKDIIRNLVRITLPVDYPYLEF